VVKSNLKQFLSLGFLLIFTIGCTQKSAQVNPDNITYNLRVEPPNLHPIMSTDASASDVHFYVLDSLAARNRDTFEWEPRLAESWEVSKDQKTFTFKLRENIFFHDGKPITAEDIKFSFDAIFEPKYNAAHLVPYYENIDKVEIVDPRTVKFSVKSLYFMNFDVAAGLTVIPKHVYQDADKSKAMVKEVVGSGPYTITRFDKGQRMILTKFDQWYGNADPVLSKTHRFKTVTFRFVKEENVYLEMLKKGDLDYEDLNAEQFMKKTEGAPFGQSVLKYKVQNATGKGYRFVGWNLRNPLFQNRDVRVALAHLMNREEMNKKFRYNLSVLATGPADVFADFASKDVKPILFDPTKAQELLKKAGWADSNKDGVLDRMVDGKRQDFKFSLIHANKDNEKYFTFYREDLKKAGIDMEVKFLEWNSFLKMLDDGKFEAVALAWTTGVNWDPKQIWHSSSAVTGGSNFVGYKNPVVDQMIDRARVEMDYAKRIPLLKKVYEEIAKDAPYVFMFNEQYSFYAHASRIEKPKDTFKYGIGTEFWFPKP
jgi:peptide/nickel transport system substrate-binding protein/microcin C transport system substrate-binding protein